MRYLALCQSLISIVGKILENSFSAALPVLRPRQTNSPIAVAGLGPWAFSGTRLRFHRMPGTRLVLAPRRAVLWAGQDDHAETE